MWTNNDYHQLILTFLIPYLYTSKIIQTKCSGIAVCCAVKNSHKSMAYPWTAFISDHFCYHIRSQYFATTSCMSIVVIIVRGYFFSLIFCMQSFLKNSHCCSIHPVLCNDSHTVDVFNYSFYERDNNLSLQN